MAGIAAIAKEVGLQVSGSDAKSYPPMSTLLEALDINVSEGYAQTKPLADKTIVIGNALSRGNNAVEYTLNHRLPYISGPQWLYENVLRDKTVFAVAGTHGKTTTSSILAWILSACGKAPGFLIGGKPGNFDRSAQLGESELFVIEADEYDTAFFDKRSKFIHYNPQLTILNNLEFDHADIFADLDAIKTQFHQLLRTLPSNGKLIINADDQNLSDLVKMGCWTPIDTFSIQKPEADWFASAANSSVGKFDIHHAGEVISVNWGGLGRHNMSNALAAVAAAHHAGVAVEDAAAVLSDFIFPNKRLEIHTSARGFTLYEDFAHHPTAIRETLRTLSHIHPNQRLIAILELRSNTMKMGVHQHTLAPALAKATFANVVSDTENCGLDSASSAAISVHPSAQICLDKIGHRLEESDVVVVMSNGDFDGLVEKLSKI